MDNTLLQRITHNPNICHGKPCIRGLHYSTSGYYEAQFYPYPFPILTFETVCVPHSRRKCCIQLSLFWNCSVLV
ncbi:DUF433 domain-containing protein [Nostoc sp. HG1]|nr:DUF433 domain-containing protein [Nostoc sp. HG1]